MSVEVGHSGLDRVPEKLATSDKITIVIERQLNGKMRVTSGSWDHEKAFFRDQVLEVRWRGWAPKCRPERQKA
jgi:hypothetical protein